jgi:predicted nucleic acid-binding protein
VIYLDTGILVRGLLRAHPLHSACYPLIASDAVSSCHTLAELFNTLTGAFTVPNDAASEMIALLPSQMKFETISESDYLAVIAESRQRGIQGGIIYDAIHAEIARRLKVDRIVTYNLTNFRHVAPDMRIAVP